jgi:glycosyltransferase involved in cell wall biosynthesis
MRILMVAHNVAWRGSAIRALSLARPLAAMGHELTVIASRERVGTRVTHQLIDGVRLLQFPDIVPGRFRNAGLSPVDLLGRVSHVLRERYDIVHAFEQRPCSTLPALLARRSRRSFSVVDWADLWGHEGMAANWPSPQRLTLGAFDGVWQTYTYRRADAVTAISSDLADRALRLGIPADRVRLVPIGANDDLFTPTSSSAPRQRLGIPDDALVLVHTGFAPFDDWLLGRVFADLAAREPRAWLVMTGRRVAAVDAAAASAGAADRVLQLGVLAYRELGDVMACGDVMLVPYTKRPHNTARFPNRVGDYLAAGRPVATNPTGDLGRLVVDEGIGIVAPEDPGAFASAVLDLLHRPQERATMGARARTLAETTFSWRARAETLDALYRELVETGPRGSSSS